MCRGGMARGAGGGVGERRGWLCSKSNGGRRGRSEGLGRVTGRTRESPEREWNQYVEASVCPWPHMRVSCLGRPNMRVSTRGRGGRAKAGVPHPSLVQPSGPGEYAPLRMCDRVRGIRLCETLLEFLVGVFVAMVGSVKIYFPRKS